MGEYGSEILPYLEFCKERMGEDWWDLAQFVALEHAVDCGSSDAEAAGHLRDIALGGVADSEQDMALGVLHRLRRVVVRIFWALVLALLDGRGGGEVVDLQVGAAVG